METEIKLALAAALAPRLRRHALLAGLPVSRRRLLSLYFDTPGFDLQRRRIALRVRRVGRQWIQTVKAETRQSGALSSRPEWEAQLRGPQPDLDMLPAEARKLFDVIDIRLLAEVFQTDFQRSAWQLAHAGGRMELALDLGVVKAGEANRAISEVEIELQSGPVEALYSLARQLLAELPLRIEPRSKALRGYLLCGALRAKPVRVPAPDLRPEQRAGEAWQAALEAALAQFGANLTGFLEQPDELEYLHQLRVATRRLRSLAGLAEGIGLPRPAWLAGLRDLMSCLNPARDWDVFFSEILPAVDAHLVGTLPAPALLADMQARAAEARRLAQVALCAPGTTALLLDIEQSLLTTSASGLDAGSWAGRVLDPRWDNLRRQAARYEQLDESERHALRLRAKKLRYTAELFAPLGGRRGKIFMTAMADLQDRLGLANDAVVAGQLLAVVAEEQPELAFEAGRLAGAVAALTSRQAAGGHKLGKTLMSKTLKVKPFWPAPSAGD